MILVLLYVSCREDEMVRQEIDLYPSNGDDFSSCYMEVKLSYESQHPVMQSIHPPKILRHLLLSQGRMNV